MPIASHDTLAEARQVIEALDQGGLDLAAAMARLRALAARRSRADDVFEALAGGALDVRGALAQLRAETVAAPPDDPPAEAAPAPGAKVVLRDPAWVDADAAAPRAPARSRVALAPVEPPRAPPRAPPRVEPPAPREVVRVARHAGHVAVVTMCDLANQNMLTRELGEALEKTFAALAADDSVRVVVLRGEDPWFSAGGTLETVSRVREGTLAFTSSRSYRVLLDCPLPTVAAVSGDAVGGGLVMGLYGDAVVLAESRRYAANFLRHGITPGVGATYIVPHRLGALLGGEMLYAARLYHGRELRERGAPVDVVPASEVLPRALARAEEFARHPRELLVRLKARLTAGLRREVDAAIEEELCLHREAALAASPPAPSPAAAAPRPAARAPLRVERRGAACYATLDRPEARNSLTAGLVADLLAALAEAEADPECRALVLQGNDDDFCSGMDLAEAAEVAARAHTGRSPYMDLLKRFAASPLLVVAAARGRVLAGGVGLAAAADVLLAAPTATFALSEALFGLLPAQVLPYLVRRAGFQHAYRMTLTAAPLDAREALRCGLADEVCEDLDARVRWYARRVAHVPRETVADAKGYFRTLWVLDEATERSAVVEFERLVRAPRFLERVRRFLGEDAPTERD